LNSLLILARLLADNDENNLTPSQVESAQVIYNSGSDLLALINEILDLSKVEAGRMIFNFAPADLTHVVQNMHAQFDPVAQQKGLAFESRILPQTLPVVETDQQRVEQILKNLLSNAFKFTEQGRVELQITLVENFVALHVRDTGIGMTPEQQMRVFHAFQQADGSTSRKYGGTGLGLTISRELATRLGGRLEVQSEPGKGSTFTLLLPIKSASAAAVQGSALPQTGDDTPAQAGPTTVVAPIRMKSYAPTAFGVSSPYGPMTQGPQVPLPGGSSPALSQPNAIIPDDRAQIDKGDRVLLIIEDDTDFAKVLYDYAHRHDFKCLVALDGESGLALANHYHPDAILLDLKLPGINGWDVLDLLKQDAALRHIPVHILSAQESTLDAYKRGALGFLSKPVGPEELNRVFQQIGEFLARSVKSLLLIEDDAGLRFSVSQLLSGNDVRIMEVSTGQAALDALRAQSFDCMILDLNLPDMSGFDLLNQIHQGGSSPAGGPSPDKPYIRCPVIVYTGQALSEKENMELLKYADSVIIKGVKSPERLLDETALFLHRVVAQLPEEKQRAIKRLHSRDAFFEGKKALVVDDDMRNAFALSRLLEEKGLKVTIARSGKKALEVLAASPDFDVILMDIMMPEMDGYEAIQRIRTLPNFHSLPILALTAKAMKGDMDKCLAAGASDYLSKPVDADRLFSMLRVWLYR